MSLVAIGTALVVVAAVVEGFAHVCLKKAAHADVTKRQWMALGILFFLVEAAIYTVALQWLEIGTAYTLGALSFIATALFSWWLLQERVDRRHWAGLWLIVLGCGLVAVKG